MKTQVGEIAGIYFSVYIKLMRNARRKIVLHKDQAIIYLDHRNLEGEAYLRAVEDSLEEATKSDMSQRLILIDATGAVVDKAVLKALKKLTAQSAARIGKVAVLGTSGVQRFFMRTIAAFSKTNIKPFDDREAALSWLTEQSKAG